MHYHRFIKFLIICSIFFLFNTKVFASSLGIKDTVSNLYIESDRLTIDRIKQKIEYRGKVKVYYDDALLQTEILEVFYKEDKKEKTIDYIVIPKKLIVKKLSNNELLTADSAKYFLSNKQLILLGNVIMQHKENILKTNKLIYYIDLKTVIQK